MSGEEQHTPPDNRLSSRDSVDPSESESFVPPLPSTPLRQNRHLRVAHTPNASHTNTNQMGPPGPPGLQQQSQSQEFMTPLPQLHGHPGTRTRSRSASTRRRRRSSDYESIYFGSPNVRHFSSALNFPQFRNRLAALSLTASGQDTQYFSSNRFSTDRHTTTTASGSGSGSGSGSFFPPSSSSTSYSSLNPPFSHSSSTSSAIISNNFVVFDIGNRFIRAGFAGDSQPRCEIPVEFAWSRIQQTPCNDFPLNTQKGNVNNDNNEDMDTPMTEDTNVYNNDENNNNNGYEDDSDEDYEDEKKEEKIFGEDFYLHWLWSLKNIAVIPPGLEDTQLYEDHYSIPWYKTNHKRRLECVLEIIVRHIFSMYVYEQGQDFLEKVEGRRGKSKILDLTPFFFFVFIGNFWLIQKLNGL